MADEANAIMFKLPQFWQTRSHIGFGQAETQFAMRNITQDTTKFYHVMASLDQDTATHVVDLITNPPAADKYDTIKGRLIAAFTPSDLERANTILDMPELGVDKLSYLMSKMLALIDDHDHCVFFRAIFLRRLPDDVRIVLASSRETDLRKLALEADELIQAQSRGASAVQKRPLGTKREHRGGPAQQPGLLLLSQQVWQRGQELHSSMRSSVCQAASPAVGKRTCWPPVSAAAAGPSINSASFTILYHKSNRCFLVDTGAEVSVIAATLIDKRLNPIGRPFSAANGTPILTYGTRTVSLHIAGRTYQWPCILAAVSRPLLGADFLRHHSLLVNIHGQQLVHARTFATVPLCSSKVAALHLESIAQADDSYGRLLAEFPDLTAPTFTSTPKHGVFHYIQTTGPPVHTRARRLSPENSRIAKAEFDKMMKLGVCRRSNSQHCCPLVLVDKADGYKRPSGNYTLLNNVTVPDRYPVLHIQDFSANLVSKHIFSKVDLVRGYHQIPVAPEDVPKTAVITPFGLFEFLRMPFGLRNTAQTFQRLMDNVCAGLDFAFVYLDDILVASCNKDKYKKHLRLLFTRLHDHGLSLNQAKCGFGASTLDFLGHQVSSKGVVPLPSKVDTIKDFPAPHSVKALQEFVGMINFYHRFLPSAARILCPLYQALSGKAQKRTFEWTQEMMVSFNAAKAALAQATMLCHPQPAAKISLTTDASDVAVGVVLQQHVGEVWQPLAFFSKQVRPPEVKYSAFDRELLAVYLVVKHFRYYLEGRDFTVFTNQKPLTFALRRVSDPWSKHQQRHLSFIPEYTTDLQHISSKDNPVADALSRAVISAVQDGLNFEEMA